MINDSDRGVRKRQEMTENGTEKYRLLTRSDFDGLVCAILLKDLGMLDDIKFVHPKDMQDGLIEVTDRDILTNLPYVPGCFLCFDHHDSEKIRNADVVTDNYILDPNADSAARVAYEHFGGAERFTTISDAMMEAVDVADAARFSREDILEPAGWALLSFLMDARTGLGRFRNFRVSNYQLMMDLIDYCKDASIENILALPDVKERVDLFMEHQALQIEQIKRCTTVHDNVAVFDLRDEETIYAGNRFMIYALYPETNISIHVIWGLKQQNTVFTVGRSIINRSGNVSIGELMLEYGGGGHENAGTCQIENDRAADVQGELIDRLTEKEPSLA